MKITSFKLDNQTKDWHLEETAFDNFNLLVGISGVGKTRILKTLQQVCQVATHDRLLQEVVDWNWKIGFVHASQEYEWVLKTSKDSIEPAIIYEQIIKKVAGQNRVVLERSQTTNQLDGQNLPKLINTQSAIYLLGAENSIAPIYSGFKRRLTFTDTRQAGEMAHPEKLLEKFKPRQEVGLEKFKESVTPLPTLTKAYLLQAFYQEEWHQISQEFNHIFPSVTEIKVSFTQRTEGFMYFFNIKENNQWISQPQMSFGMFHTLVYLIDISLAPRDSVIVIDEFENSLGINCMPELTDFIISKAPLMQFILTSHHPYIINNIPWKTWQLVTRKGGYVRVTNATQIPHLQTASSMEKFIQLINLPEYEEGIL